MGVISAGRSFLKPTHPHALGDPIQQASALPQICGGSTGRRFSNVSRQAQQQGLLGATRVGQQMSTTFRGVGSGSALTYQRGEVSCEKDSVAKGRRGERRLLWSETGSGAGRSHWRDTGARARQGGDGGERVEMASSVKVEDPAWSIVEDLALALGPAAKAVAEKATARDVCEGYAERSNSQREKIGKKVRKGVLRKGERCC